MLKSSKHVVGLLVLFLFVSLFAVLANPVVASDGAENSWVSVSSLPTVRGDLGVAAVNGKIYAIGGIFVNTKTTPNNEETLGTNEEYNPATNSWTTKTPMPIPSSNFATAVYQNKIYCVGGGVTDVFNSTRGTWTTVISSGFNQVYDPLTDTWENKTAMPYPQVKSHANVVNGKIFFVGGYPNGTLNQMYDPVTDNWSVMAAMPEKFQGASCVYDNKIYIIGTLYTGKLPDFSEPMTQIYNPSTDSWSQGPTALQAVARAFAVVTVGAMAPPKIYDLYNPSHAPNSYTYLNQVYNLDNGTWVTAARMPDRERFGVAVVDDLIYVIGGYTFSWPSLDDIIANPDNRAISYSYKGDVLRYTPFGYGSVPPKALVASPLNASSFTIGDVVSFNFLTNRAVDWVGYSLDGADNVTVTGNFSLSDLTLGSHSVTVYAKDSNGNIGASETVVFSVSEKSFPVAVVIAVVVAAVVVVGLVFVLRVKKR